MAETKEPKDAATNALRMYVQRVTTVLDTGELNEDEDGRNVFVDNVLEEIKGSEFRLACDMRCSGAIEKIVRICTPQQLATLFHRVSEHVDGLLVSRCGSHVMQGIVERLSSLFAEEEKPLAVPEGSEAPAPLSVQFFNFCDRLTASLGSLIVDTYASHVIRASICVLSGLALTSFTSTLRSKSSQNYRGTFVQGGGDDSGKTKTALAKPIQTAAFPVIGRMATALLQLVCA
jgi:nucleolar protein 9